MAVSDISTIFLNPFAILFLMSAKELAESLNAHERKVLPLIGKIKGLDELASAAKIEKVGVLRALQWLQNKKLVELEASLAQKVFLDKNGEKYLKTGMPEKRFLSVLNEKPKTIEQIKMEAKLEPDEVTVSLGILKKKSAIIILKEGIAISKNGNMLLGKQSLEESLIKKISKSPLDLQALLPEEKFALEELKKRREIIRIKPEKEVVAKITALGKDVLGQKTGILADELTPEMLIGNKWENVKFRRYDVNINVPKIHPAKKQHYRKFLDEVRQKFLSLGFEEMSGPVVETNFWDMDALFMPQFHSARDIHAAYFVKDPKYAKIDKKIVLPVKNAHEKGVDGSRGWGYKFDENETQRTLLRTQGTACSARMLASKNLKVPGKYFGIQRCFRPDVVDATHNADFNQAEGIVVEENLNLRHLFGLLELFAREFAGAKEIKIVPGYFPFTEPSCELFAKHPDLGWIELGGAGIFRPELVIPLAKRKLSVLAWGIGIDRIAMFKLGIKDIRQLFSHDLQFLREARTP